MLFGTVFQDIAILGSNGVPNFRLALVYIIDGGKIQILLMPTKKSLPGSNITIGLCDSFDFIGNGVSEQRVQGVEIPSSSSGVHE